MTGRGTIFHLHRHLRATKVRSLLIQSCTFFFLASFGVVHLVLIFMSLEKMEDVFSPVTAYCMESGACCLALR